MSNSDRKTPVEPWNLHPHDVKVSPGLTGQQQRNLEEILSTVHKVLDESRDIKENGQKCADIALKAVSEMPSLKRRMLTFEVICIAATLANIASCLHH